ncbi:MAG: protease modulator HflC [Burkholderiales bacterium]|nr:protease modulator HflC [Burkholderiales bacterium]
MPRIFALLAAVIFGLIVFSSCVFLVDQRQYAVVFALGEVKRVVETPGLHFKVPAPFQNVIYLERRILTIDTPDTDRFITAEKKNLLVDSFVKWRIADPKLYFVSFSGDERRAQDRIGQIVKAALNEEITKRTVREVVSGERTKVMQTIVAKVADDAKQAGIDIVDVRLKRVDLVPEVSESVFRRMEAERKRVANELRSTGGAESEQIRADADRQREVILADAYRQAQVIKGEGDAKAASIYNAAFGQNPEFFAFYRSLEAYRQTFKNKSDVILVDPQSDFLRFMRNSGSGKAGK